MEQLETIKGKSVVIPRLVNRYVIFYYDVNQGWQTTFPLHTTPESAVQQFIDEQSKYPNKNVKYYKVIEVELEIPFIPKS